MCGAPAIDKDGALCGVVEGIVPVDSENKNLAGTAAFLPSFVLASFIDYAERSMLEQAMPKDIFADVIKAKETNTLGGGSTRISKDDGEEGTWEETYEHQVEMLKKKYSKEEVDAILWNIKVCVISINVSTLPRALGNGIFCLPNLNSFVVPFFRGSEKRL